MRFVISLVLSFALAASFFFDSFRLAEAAAKIQTYPNCAALNKDYPGGVARSASVKNKGGKTRYKPYVSKALYDANKRLDRDKDGIACER
ncbi:excalibur calcium-binding domain-containing protein [Geobacillus sp. BMUD]|uniref:excalibur calcium-binding domain-containing protein n=1 Tax=Geobacillus TaxID=129337 RepID=UPI0004DF87D2|nr:MULTISPECIES: excalibur calcium-binding domain-containing protein [Geobacillus]NNU82873.1 excalibur calcium-binding domain-containing protein [Geobacillus sp. BMUD]